MKRLYLYIIVGLVVALFFANYIPGTYLSGWDNLQTDLAPWLGVKRAFFSVWQEYQSFGLNAGMGHAADLLRAISIWILSFVLPQSLLRYVLHFTLIAIGGVGTFTLLNETFSKKDQQRYAFLGAFFYLFNFATIQILYLPFEAFTVFYAALPWGLWIFLKNLHTPNRKNLTLFFLINILATPLAVAQQLFLVYMMILGLIGLGYYIQTRTQQTFIHYFRHFTLLIIGIIAIHSFWIMPQLYFLATNGTVVRESKINQIATEDIFYSNLEKGDFNHFIRMEGFFYDRLGREQIPLFLNWKLHREQLPLNFLIYIPTLIIITGFFTKTRYRTAFLLVLSLVVISLLNNTFPFDLLNIIFRQNSFINQIFRSPFTKFIIPYSLCASYFFACGAKRIVEIAQTQYSTTYTKQIVFSVIFLLLVTLSFPAWTGNYLSQEMRVKIPQDYFSVMEYFQNENKNKRIAILPEYTFWGWYFTSWGYNGSGFLWYGIEQPIISRTFDVWSFTSESYFWEIKAATEAEDQTQLAKVLEKYNIDYLLVDHSLQPVISTYKSLQYDRIDTLLEKSPQLQLIQKGEYLSLYKFNQPNTITGFVTQSTSVPSIGPRSNITAFDPAFSYGGIYSTDTKSPDVYFPFFNLFSQTQLKDKVWEIRETDQHVVLSSELSFDPNEYELIIPTTEITEGKIDLNDPAVQTSTDGKTLSIVLPKESIQPLRLSDTIVANCKGEMGSINSSLENDQLKIESYNNATGCFGFGLDQIEQHQGYLVKIKNTNEEGRRLYFYVVDSTKKQTYIEDRIQTDTAYYWLLPRYKYGIGYTLNFHNNSYEGLASRNTLKQLEVYQLPVEQFQKMYFVKKDFRSQPITFSSKTEAKKINYYTYEIKPEDTMEQIILYQSYDPGWNAYAVTQSNFLTQNFPFLFGNKLEEHVSINNWANGWKISDSKESIIILFWPQYLQYMGYFLLIFTFMILMKINKKEELKNHTPLK